MKKNLILTSFLFIIITILFTYQIFPYFFSGIPYTLFPSKYHEIVTNKPGDHFQWLYHLTLLKKAIQNKMPFFTEGYQFSTPYKFKFINLYFPPLGILYFFFSFLGLSGSYNFLLIFSFLISFISSFYYLKIFKVDSKGAFLGSIIFTLFPYRIATLFGGHPAGMMIPFIPLLFLSIELIFKNKNIFASFLGGVLMICFAASEPHYHYYIFLFLPIYLAFIYFRNNFKQKIINTSSIIKILKSPFSLNFSNKILNINAIFSLFSFIILYSFRRNNYLPIFSILIIFVLSIITFYIIFLSNYLILKLFNNNNNSYNSNTSSIFFNLFYLYFIQLITNIQNLAFILVFLFISLYYGKLLIYIGFDNIKNSTKILYEQIIKIFKYFIPFIKVSLPFILGLIISISYVFHIKKSSYDSSNLKKGRELNEIKLFSPKINDIFNSNNNNSSKYIYFGFIPFCLLLISFIFIIKKVFINKTITLKELNYLFFLALFFISFILSIGPNFNYLPLFYLCRKFIPYFGFIRSPIKIIIFSSLSLSIILGIFFSYKWNKAFKNILIVLIIIEFFLIFNNFGINIINNNNKVLDLIKHSNNSKKILYLPIWPGNSSYESIYQIFSVLTDKYMINGYQPAVPKKYIEEVANKLYPLNLGYIEKKEYDLIHKLNISHIVFHKEAFPSKISPFPQKFTSDNLKNNPYIDLIEYDDPLYLYKVKNIQKIEKFTHKTHSSGFVKAGIHFNNVNFNPIKKHAHSSLGKVILLQNNSKISFDSYFPKGNFNGFISFCGNHNKTSLIEIIIKQKEKVLFSHDFIIKSILNTSPLNLPISFNISKTEETNFTFIYKGDGELLFDYFYCIFDDQNDPKNIVYPEDGIFIGKLIKDTKGNSILHIKDNTYTEGPAMLAPNRFYKKGKYNAKFYIKGNFTSNDICLKLQVTDAYKRKIFAERKLFKKDFNNNWQTYDLAFNLEHDSILNFHVNYLGHGDLWIKKVEVENQK